MYIEYFQYIYTQNFFLYQYIPFIRLRGILAVRVIFSPQLLRSGALPWDSPTDLPAKFTNNDVQFHIQMYILIRPYLIF